MPQPLVYRSVVGAGRVRRFAAWLNGLRHSSGAYIIRSKSTHEVLYVGESHTGRLADTVKRHFYKWEDGGGRNHFTASPGAVQVAVRVTPPTAAVGAQNNLINRLSPKRNKQGFADQVPF